MFNRKHSLVTNPFSTEPVRPLIETLEDRKLLSASFHVANHGGGGLGFGGHGHNVNTIQFSQAPAAVQHGLDTLATSDRLTPPAPNSTQTVYLGNSNGVETYSIILTGTGTRTQLTVDQNGNAVTAPTVTTTTFGAITNTAVTNEINKIATALGLTAPTSTTTVRVSTPASGPATYTVRLSSSSTTSTGRHNHGTTITVDANGNPAGNENVPFSVLSAAIQNGINAHLPTGATALASDSTQTVSVRTINGVVTYSTTFTANGTQTTVSVNSAGSPVTLPSTSTAQFSTIPQAAQTELQALATADGGGTISSSQNVTVYNEGNGTSVYSVSVSVSSTTSSGTTRTYSVTVSSDQAGNPTVPPSQRGEAGEEGFGGFQSGDFNFGGFRFGRR